MIIKLMINFFYQINPKIFMLLKWASLEAKKLCRLAK
jgi:hypothetical protein